MNVRLDKAGISRAFTDAACAYDQWAQAQRSIAADLVRRIPDTPVRRQMLDLGCGTGALVDPLMQRFPDATLFGLDLAPGMIDVCRSKWADNPQLDFEQADIETFNCDRTFDLVCSSCTFQWLADLDLTIRHWTDRLLPGGMFAAAVLIAGSFDELSQAYAHATGRPMPGLCFPQPEDVPEPFVSAGLRIELAEAEQISVCHADAREVILSFRRTGANFRYQADYSPLPVGPMRRLIDFYETHFAEAAGRVPVTYHVLYLLAEKQS